MPKVAWDPTVRSDVQDLLDRYARKGAAGSFQYRPGALVECGACGKETPAEDITVLGLERLHRPRADDPQVAVAGLECPECGTQGTLVFAPGPASPGEEAEVLALLAGRAHIDQAEAGALWRGR